MAVQINIDENKIDNFSDGAQTTLKKQMEKYADDIIKEANLIEEAIREDGANTEIRNNIVHSTNNRYTTTELRTMLDDVDKIISKIKKIV